jgi:succinate dehydrogenase/fumarate reductase flavoprotein subunit
MAMPTAMFADGAVLRNAQGERFMLRHNPRHGEMQIEKARIALAVQEEIEAGRGCRGAVFFDTSGVARARLESYVSHFTRLQNAGIDPSAGPILIKPAAHSQMGGIRIDPHCRTEVNGLLAAGEASGGVHGASRIAGNGASDALIFGGIAGRTAAGGQSQARSIPWEDVHRNALDGFEAVAPNPHARSPDEVKHAVREVMLSHVGLRRNAEGLSGAVDALSVLRECALGGLRLERPSDRIRAHEALGFITIGEVIARSALARCESRGAHWRIDHPVRDDAHWMRHVTAHRSAAGAIEIGTTEGVKACQS